MRWLTAPWTETTFSTILFKCKLNNIFDAGKFGLFCQCLPNKTNHLLDEKCSRGKNSKVRLTGTAAASVTGEKLKIFVIDKLGAPRYCHQRKIWMTSELFEEWLRKLSWKITLVMNNYPDQPHVENITNANLFFTSWHYLCATANGSRGCKKFVIKELHFKKLCNSSKHLIKICQSKITVFRSYESYFIVKEWPICSKYYKLF